MATEFSLKMERQLRRIFYVTPTNFIELLKGYEKILKAKQMEIGNQATKLRNGLGRLASASLQVADMTTESETKRAEVSKKTQECQDLKIDLAKQEKAAHEA
jgi:dynein heavy chain